MARAFVRDGWCDLDGKAFWSQIVPEAGDEELVMQLVDDESPM